MTINAQRIASIGHTQQETARDDQPADIQGPAKILHLHVQDRETSKVAGAPRAWRKLSQLYNAYQLERLGPLDSGEARSRLTAGEIFTKLWDTAQSAGRDSTQALDGAGSNGGTPLSEVQRAAIQRLVSIELHLGMRDRAIIRAVCAYGHSPREAMVMAKMPSDTRVTARFCEALDALADAVDRTEKRGR